MRFVKPLAIVAVLVLAGAGCSAPNTSGSTVKIETPSGDKIHVKEARSLTEQHVGLSGSKDIGDGMLFCFSEYKVQKFWMLDMHVPIDMIWIEDEKVTGVADNVPIETNNDWTRRESGDAVNTVLEVPAGMAAELGIVRGSVMPDVGEICSK
ncbi:MAG TPA: DUF192 domain-containing protein [Patescibacteria group bacterium]|nr:DUF192 domain-containing protein [Patescibacteria group bacterium]